MTTAPTTLAETALLQSKDGPVKKFHILKQFGGLLRQTKTNDELKRLSCAELTELVGRALKTGAV